MIRIHAGMATLVALFGLSFLLDPCGGGGDLCLGGVVGVVSLSYAGIGIGAMATWWLARRASPLLVWDSILVTLAGATLIGSGGGPVPLITLGLVGLLMLGVPGAVLSGRAVSRHRIERIVAIIALLATTLLGIGVIVVAIVGTVALLIGWFLERGAGASTTPQPDT
jgi:hypothetical protein